MSKLFSTIRNIFSITELRKRILYTLALLLVFRAGSYIVLPGINASQLSGEIKGILSLLNTLLGGAFSNASIFALGVMPYISASIIIQLLSIALPYFQRLRKEGDAGNKKINQITRLLTVLVAIFQSTIYLSTSISKDIILVNRVLFMISSTVLLTTGTLFCMWLGERISDKGIGNGVSMLIMIGIVSSLPGALIAEAIHRGTRGILLFIIEMLVLFLIVVFVVLFTQAIRKLPIQYAKQVIGKNLYGGQRQYIPLKLNNVGVMPIIFAQVLMFFLVFLINLWAKKSMVAVSISSVLMDFTSWQYNIVFSILIILFTFFYTAITINPHQIAEDMKRNNSFLPGIPSGKATALFIDDVLSKITLPGSFFLATIAILPVFANIAGISSSFSRFYGGTSLLIMVGVVFDTFQQIEGYLLMRHYDGIMKVDTSKGNLRNFEFK